MKKFKSVPKSEWPEHLRDPNRSAVYLNGQYLVQVFDEEFNGIKAQRLSVNSTKHTGGTWQDKIPWDDLYEIKNKIVGYSAYAVEIYPRSVDLVNVSNMRHLWVLSEPLAVGWHNQELH